MKKNLIAKILLAMVAVALVFALASCSLFGGGGDDTGDDGNSGSDTTALKAPVLSISGATVKWETVQGAKEYQYTIYDADGKVVETKTTAKTNRSVTLTEGQSVTVIAVAPEGSKYSNSEPSNKVTYVPGALAQVKSIINGADTLIDILNKAQTFLSADVSVGGYIRAGETINDGALRVQANLDGTNPSAMFSVIGNGEVGASLGYAENKLLVKAGEDGFYINLKGFDPAEDALMGKVLDIVKGVDINFSELAGVVNETIDSVGSLLPEDMLKTLINIEAAEDGKSVTLGIGCTALNTVLGMTGPGGMLSTIDIDSYASYIDKVPEILGNETVKKVLPAVAEMDLSWMNWNSIKAKIAANKTDASLLKIVVGYDAKKVINGLDVVIDLSAIDKINLDYAIGLSVDIALGNTANSKTAIDTTGYTAKEVEIDLGAGLDKKGVALDGKAVFYLSNAAKSNDEVIAKAILTSKKEGSSPAYAVAYATASAIFLDMSQVFAQYDIEDKVSQYKFEYDFNLIDKVNELATSAVAANAADGEGFSVGGINVTDIINSVVDIFSEEGEIADKIGDLCSFAYETVAGIAGLEETESEFIAKYVAEYAQIYSKIDLADSFGAIISDIIDTHTENEQTLLASLKVEEGSAAVQVIGTTDDAGLLGYIANFILIPALEEGKIVEGESVDATRENIYNWIDFALNREMGNTTYLAFVNNILGTSLYSIINSGLAFKVEGAITNDEDASVYGLNGAVYAKESMDAEDSYVMVSGGIFWQAEGTQDTGVDRFNGSSYTAFNAQDAQENYYIAEAFKALLTELLNFGE